MKTKVMMAAAMVLAAISMNAAMTNNVIANDEPLTVTLGKALNLNLVTDLGLKTGAISGDKVAVKVEKLPKGLKLVDSGSSYKLTGVPTEEVDFDLAPMYAKVTITRKSEKIESVYKIPLAIVAEEAQSLVLNRNYNGSQAIQLDSSVTAVSGLPSGLKFTAKAVPKSGVAAHCVYGTPKKAGLFAVKVKVGKVQTTEYWRVTYAANTGAGVASVMSDLTAGVITSSGITPPAGAKVSASGLPSGVKLVYNKANGKYTFEGTPTKAGGFIVTVKTTLNGVTVLERFAYTVDALPDFAVGNFQGAIETKSGDDICGLIDLTTTAAGKVSGKLLFNGQTWTFSLANFATASATECTASGSAKNGSSSMSLVITMTEDEVSGRLGNGMTFTAWPNVWKDKTQAASLKSTYATVLAAAKKRGESAVADSFIDKWTISGTPVEVTMTLSNNGTIKATANYKGYKVSASAILLDATITATSISGMAVIYFPPKSGKFVGAACLSDFYVDNKSVRGVQLWKDGPYWAECNVGANSPEEFGYYFWWGDTIGYTYYGGSKSWDSYLENVTFVSSAGRWMNYSPFDENRCPIADYTYSQLRTSGYIDSTGNLTEAHDAATAHMGSLWRMPTSQDFVGLAEKCNSVWTKRNGVYGRLVTGKGDYSGKSIFLPAAGICSDSSVSLTVGGYWSSTSRNNDYEAVALVFGTDADGCCWREQYAEYCSKSGSEEGICTFTWRQDCCVMGWFSLGRSVRPVRDNL